MFTLVQHKPAAGVTASGSVTFDNPIGEGNLVLCLAAVNVPSASLLEPGSGYAGDSANYVRPFSTNTWVGKLVRKIAGAAESTTITWTHAAATWEIEAMEFSGSEDSADVFDTSSPTAIGAAVATLQPGSATPAREGALCVAWCGVAGTNGGEGADPAGFTVLDKATFADMLVGYKIKADNDKTAENPAFAWTTNRNCGAGMLVYKAAEPATKRSLYIPNSVGRQTNSGGF